MHMIKKLFFISILAYWHIGAFAQTIGNMSQPDYRVYKQMNIGSNNIALHGTNSGYWLEIGDSAKSKNAALLWGLAKYKYNFGSTFDSRTLIDKGYADSIIALLNAIKVNKSDSSTNGGYYPYATNPKGYLVSGDLSGYVPTSRTITINGISFDLSANRTWNVGTVTQSQLDDSTEAIRADFPSGTPTLNEVTTAGNTTFNPIFITYSSAGTSAFSTINQSVGSAIYASNTGSGLVGNFELEHTSTNTARTIVSYSRSTTGTAAAGLGQKHSYLLEADAGGSYEAASLNILWDDPTEAAATSRVVFNTMGAGSVLNTLTLNGNAQIQFNEYTGTNFNTAQAKVAMVGTDGKIYAVDTTGLFGGITGGGTNNANVGSGYRWLKPGTQEIKTSFAGFGILKDSTTNTDGITDKVDTTSGGVASWVRTKFIIDSLQREGWGNQSVNNDYRYYIDMSGSTHANGFFSSTGTGSSAVVIAAAIDGWFYGRDLQTGTTTTGRAYCLSQTGGYNIISINSSFRYSAGVKIRLEDLSDGTETFGVMFGFMDDVNNYASVVDGFGFRYIHSDSSGTFIAWTKSNSTITEDATDITVAADTDYRLQVYTIGGVAYFYINGVLKSTIATNVPSGTARATSLGMSIFKSAGTTSRHMYVNTFGYDWRDN